MRDLPCYLPVSFYPSVRNICLEKANPTQLSDRWSGASDIWPSQTPTILEMVLGQFLLLKTAGSRKLWKDTNEDKDKDKEREKGKGRESRKFHIVMIEHQTDKNQMFTQDRRDSSCLEHFARVF